jgi:hypothetical protein
MQTKIEKLTKTEQKVEQMGAYAGNNCKLLGEQIRYLEKQQKDWFSAYHTLRELNEVGREIQLSSERLEQILAQNAKNNPQILAAMIAVEKRSE